MNTIWVLALLYDFLPPSTSFSYGIVKRQCSLIVYTSPSAHLLLFVTLHFFYQLYGLQRLPLHFYVRFHLVG